MCQRVDLDGARVTAAHRNRREPARTNGVSVPRLGDEPGCLSVVGQGMRVTQPGMRRTRRRRNRLPLGHQSPLSEADEPLPNAGGTHSRTGTPSAAASKRVSTRWTAQDQRPHEPMVGDFPDDRRRHPSPPRRQDEPLSQRCAVQHDDPNSQTSTPRSPLP